MCADHSFQESDLSLHPLGSSHVSVGELLLLSANRPGEQGAGDKTSYWVKLAVLTQARTSLPSGAGDGDEQPAGFPHSGINQHFSI